MAEVTPNLGLKKPLESEFVSIQTLNENMDKVDQSLGPVDDLPTTAKNAAGAISEIYDQLADKPHEQLTLTPGVQIVQGGDVPAILRPTMQGRTLVNLLGRDGNFDELSGWTTYGAVSLSTQTNTLIIGKSSLELKVASGDSQAYVYKPKANANIVSGKYYLVSSYLSNNTGAGLRIELSSSDKRVSQNSVGWKRVGFVITPSEYAKATNLAIVIEGSPGAYGYADGFMINEITSVEASEPIQTLLQKYPYVDDMRHVNAVYIENKGKNLIPPFPAWKTINPNADIIEPYKIVLTAPNGWQTSRVEITVTPSTTYCFTLGEGSNGVAKILGDDGHLYHDAPYSVPIIFTTTETQKLIYIDVYNTGGQTGTFIFADPMLNLGSGPFPFEPQKPSYLYLPNCRIRSNVDGSVADRLYTDGQGKPRVTRWFRETILDGSQAWQWHNDRVGYKEVRVTNLTSDAVYQTKTVVKYDGKILKRQLIGLTLEAEDNVFDADLGFNQTLFISVANADTGWGESYTPIADEVKAYFNGWKMYPQGGLSTDQFISGTKLWCRRSEVGLTLTDVRTVVPTEISPNFSPYRLMYQLAQSVDESVTYEGSLMLHEGDNQVEVGTGIVVRETANPTTINGKYFINGSSAAPMKYRVNKMVCIYKNQEKDDWKFANQPLNAILGLGYGETPAAQFDKTGAYSSTYLALDTYKIGITPQVVNAEYVPNIRESVESLVRELVEARTETSVLQNTKENNQKVTLPIKWIKATLLSDWSGDFHYTKDENGMVTLRYGITVGTLTLNAPVMFLPAGYFPATNTPIPTYNNDTGSAGLGLTINGTVGGVIVSGTTNFTMGHLIYGSITYKSFS